MRGRRPKLFFVVNDDAFFVSHRLELGHEARRLGYDVTVVAGEGGGAAAIERAGFRRLPLPFDRGGTSVRRDAGTLARLVALYRREKPDVVHHVTIKPVLYGSLAARAAGVRGVINAVSGLGYVFIAAERPNLRARGLRAGVEMGYRIALRRPGTKVIFQNTTDRDYFVQRGMVNRSQVTLIPGSGADTTRFTPTPLPEGEPPIVVLPARVLWDKGVGEFVEAARALRGEARFVLVGGAGGTNPASVSEAEVRAWVDEGTVEWWGHRNDMPDVFRQAHLVVLPSYREGLPLALVEAAASGRAAVTTDVAGCRDVVRDGHNGWLVPARDPLTLRVAIAEALSDRDELERRSRNGPEVVRDKMSRRAVVHRHSRLYADLLPSAASD